MLIQRAMREEDRWNGLTIDVNAKSDEGMHPRAFGIDLALNFILLGLAVDPWTYTINIGAAETSIQGRQLSLAADHFHPRHSCK
jgi:hypothetical protein